MKKSVTIKPGVAADQFWKRELFLIVGQSCSLANSLCVMLCKQINVKAFESGVSGITNI